ncbi:MAG: bifunctional diaminohydroxyphosphoribosylaminopyrimidine deaminase/5-amino-6-(5-phosphoribosylamino)uracil reductase RibD [Planctomycetota bacterium]|nr:bifunctional diaminohydroxyphosphoribosylaminopyrimidine deaminase/5-amino-6-(5-phosphoribosylamino)uracil reductase RibD [Planctomycetota bacterium]
MPDSWLLRAAELAERGRLRVEPNPPVGCVVVRGRRLVGEGWHRGWGAPHAEVEALRSAGKHARGATVYVTLEPCDHDGKTPPCSQALMRAFVKEVVYACIDPNPQTTGKGPARLREAGIGVRKARAPAAVRALLEPYATHLERKRPWVIAKWAMTLDGRIASRTGDSRWVSSQESRDWAHATFRAGVDAIVCGARTVRVDDPRLTNRSGAGKQPLRVIVCGRRGLPPKARVLRGGNTLVFAPEECRAPRTVEVVRAGAGGRVDPRRMLKELYRRGLERVLIEGGGELIGSLLDRDLVDQLVVFVAPRVIGGLGALPAVAGRGRALMTEALELDHRYVHTLDPDQVVEGYVRRP